MPKRSPTDDLGAIASALITRVDASTFVDTTKAESALAQLKVAAEQACLTAVAVGGDAVAGANTADLHCTEVGLTYFAGAEPSYIVVLSEAAPNAYKLRDFVHTQLSRAGWRNVVVETEW